MSEKLSSSDLFDRVYQRLHALATAQMRRERTGHTLQPTALVHEVFLRLVGQNAEWDNQRHFFAAAATAMRRILVEHARQRGALCRGGDRRRLMIDLDEQMQLPDNRVDLLALDDALARIEREDPRAAQIVQLRFFAGLSIADTARVLDVSPVTVKRTWSSVQAWLHGELLGSDSDAGPGPASLEERRAED